MAARFVFSVSTMRVLRGCSSIYFFTVFLPSPTLTARMINPLLPNSSFSRSTNGRSLSQYVHHVVQNSSSTTLPLMDWLLNFSPLVVVALKRGAGSLALLSAELCAKTQPAKIAILKISREVSPGRYRVGSIRGVPIMGG